MVLSYISLTADGGEHLLMCLFVICVSLMKCLFKSFVHFLCLFFPFFFFLPFFKILFMFLFKLGHFLTVEFRIFMYYRYNPLSVMCFAIFSTLRLPLHSLFYHRVTIFILVKSSLFTFFFSFMDCAFWCHV